MPVVISAIEVVAAISVGTDDNPRVQERSVYNGGNLRKARIFAERYTLKNKHSTYVCTGKGPYFVKYESRETPKGRGLVCLGSGDKRRPCISKEGKNASALIE